MEKCESSGNTQATTKESENQSRGTQLSTVPEIRESPTITQYTHATTTSKESSPASKGKPHPMERSATKGYVLHRYDLWICLDGLQGQIFSEWEAFTTLLSQIYAIDPHAKLHPWRHQDQSNHLPIDLSTVSNQALFNLPIYTPHLASQQVGWKASIELGQMRHPYIFLESSVHASQMVTRLGPWLRETKQGMWK